MRSVAQPAVLAGLIRRLEQLQPTSERRWGIMTAAEMLCHLGDAGASVLRGGQPASPPGPHPIRKWLALRTGLPWPHGLKTPRAVDPRAGGTRPGDFLADRRRVVLGLEAIARATTLAPAHSVFGPMNIADWQHWAYRHVDHHLRQFGL